ncbi:MAG: GTP cyclohydrolase I [Phototrophicaceae bacterium]
MKNRILNGNGSASNGSANGNRNDGSPRSTQSMYTNLLPDMSFNMPAVNGGVPVSGFDLADDESLALALPQYAADYPATEVLNPHDPVQFERIEKAIHDLLDAFNVNWEDPNYTETPSRVAKSYVNYWANGYARQPENEITVFPNSSGRNDLVMVKDMQFYSLCSHHLAPFKGFGAVAYVPSEYLLGLSKLGRILDIYARRFQLQERIGSQTADSIMRLIRPAGVMVILYDVEHMCMSSRGVQMHAANTTTLATRGIFETDADLRQQVLTLLK